VRFQNETRSWKHGAPAYRRFRHAPISASHIAYVSRLTHDPKIGHFKTIQLARTRTSVIFQPMRNFQGRMLQRMCSSSCKSTSQVFGLLVIGTQLNATTQIPEITRIITYARETAYPVAGCSSSAVVKRHLMRQRQWTVSTGQRSSGVNCACYYFATNNRRTCGCEPAPVHCSILHS
jgi:hypothetical protein